MQQNVDWIQSPVSPDSLVQNVDQSNRPSINDGLLSDELTEIHCAL